MKTLLLVLILIFTPFLKAQSLLVSDERLEQLLSQLENFYDLTQETDSTTLATEKLYLDELDDAINERMNLFVERQYEVIKKSIQERLESRLWIASGAHKALEDLQLRYNDFQESKKFYGTGKDFHRFNAFYAFNQSVRNSIDRQSPQAWLHGLVNIMKQIYRGLRLLHPFLRLSYYTVFPIERNDVGTPLTKAADQYFSKISDIDHIEVKFEGHRKMDPVTEPGEINLILTNHISAKNDAVVLSHLNLDSYITFGALNLKGEGLFSIATHPLLKGVLQQVDKQKDIVLLGRAQNPVAELIEILRSGRTSNLFLFPQGMISLGFNEVNPLKPDFSAKVIQALLEAGLKVRLQIMTMPDNFQNPLSTNPDTANAKTLRAHLSPPIEDQELRKILGTKGPAALDHKIRMHWIRTIRQYNPDFLGVASESFVNSMTQRPETPFCSKALSLLF